MEIVMSVLSVFFYFLGTFYAKTTIRKVLQGTGKQYKEIIFFILCMAMFMTPMWIGDENILFIFPFLVAGFLYCNKGRFLEKAVLGMVFYTLQVPINMMADSLVDIESMRQAEDIVLSLVKLIFWLCMFFLIKHIMPQNKQIQLSNSLWLLIGGLCMAPLAAIFVFSILHPLAVLGETEIYVRIYKEYTLVAYFVLPWVTLSAMMILNAIAILEKHELLKREQELAGMRKRYYERLKEEQQQARTLRHDMRNHMTIVQTMVKQGELGNALAYLEAMNDAKALTGRKGFCENEIADIVLSSKVERMEREQIPYEIKVELPKELSISEIDICSLLGNALDNAIEGVQKAADKRILIQARVDKGILMLRVENTTVGEVKSQNGKVRTTKDNKKEHGFGIAGMAEIAEMYHGYLQIHSEKQKFELLVSIPII